jgi:predicted nucleic-acid-binding Zn-ribbon protein
MRIDDQLAERFVCSKCNHRGARVKRFAATGTGISKLFDFQHNTYLTASCGNCGYTELYNPEVLEGKSKVGTVLDVIFGG